MNLAHLENQKLLDHYSDLKNQIEKQNEQFNGLEREKECLEETVTGTQHLAFSYFVLYFGFKGYCKVSNEISTHFYYSQSWKSERHVWNVQIMSSQSNSNRFTLPQ